MAANHVSGSQPGSIPSDSAISDDSSHVSDNSSCSRPNSHPCRGWPGSAYIVIASTTSTAPSPTYGYSPGSPIQMVPQSGGWMGMGTPPLPSQMCPLNFGLDVNFETNTIQGKETKCKCEESEKRRDENSSTNNQYDCRSPSAKEFPPGRFSGSTFGENSYRFPRRNRVLSNESHTFLDRFRSQASSKSLNCSPAQNSTSRGVVNGRASRVSSVNRNSSSSTSSSAEFSSQTKPRKWYSFTNLLSKQHLANILSYPRSRLSVSSTLNSVFIGTSPAETPTPNEEYHQGSFFVGAFNFYQSQQSQAENIKVPLSPTPSCVTISGEFPSRNSTKKDSSLESFRGHGERLHENGNEFIHYRPSDRENCGEYFDSSRDNTSSFPESFIGFTRHCSSANNRVSRLSCGEFFPNSLHPSGFADTIVNDPEFSSCHQTKIKSASARKALGRSLPTLLQAMESANNGQGGLNSGTKPVTTQDVFDLLYQEFAILTGAKSLDDRYIIIFPDRGNFHLLAENDYRRLMVYLTSVPPMQESESGFVLVVDRRNDKWNSVKSTLLRISSYFPGLIHRVFVLRPVGFLQKALSEVSSKLFRTENLRFHLTVCNSVSDLLIFIDSSQLTGDFGGLIHYDKVKWVQQRIEVEAFGVALHVLSKDLKNFTDSFHDMEYPNDVVSTEDLIDAKTCECSRLLEELKLASDHGENLLRRIKSGYDAVEETRPSSAHSANNAHASSSVQVINVISIERFILQIEDTSRLFQEFWTKERVGLEQCLKLRRFEQDFKELQGAFDLNVKTLNSIPDMGDSVISTDAIIEETIKFQETANEDINRSSELEIVGRVIAANNPSAVDSVEPKCIELKRMTMHFRFVLEEKVQTQKEWRQIQSTIERANKLCAEGMDLISAQQSTDQVEDAVDSGVLVKKIDAFLEIVQNISDEISTSKNFLSSATTSQSKNLLKQVHNRVEDLQIMLAKKRTSIVQHISKAKLRRNSGSMNSGASVTGFGLYPPPELKSAKSTSQLEETGKGDLPGDCDSLKSASSTLSLDGVLHSALGNGKHAEDNSESKRIKRGHVLKELLHTERTYVNEMGDILNGYIDGAKNLELKKLLPKQLQAHEDTSKIDKSGTSNPPSMKVLFGNLDDIHEFHSRKFLPDLSNCIESVELVGLCFIQRNLDFLTLYSRYCQLLPASEALRKEIGENHPWFVACRQRLNHKLPLGAYLLKPVQRITKYQLLLKDLLKHSEGCEGYPVLLDALDHMLVVLRCVNDGMLQLSIVGYPTRLQDEGPLLLQGSFMLWTETKKDRLRLKGHQRHLFLYQKSILICKKDKDPKSTSLYFKNKINLSEIGLTEVLRGSGSSKKFEIWIQGRLKVFILQAETTDSKDMWVQSIKKLLMEQLESLRVTKSISGLGVSSNITSKRHKMMAHNKGLTINGWRTTSVSHRPLRQTSSWVASDSRPRSRASGDGEGEDDGSSDMSNSDEEESFALGTYGNGESIENGPKYVALADYNAVGTAEISFKEGDILILRKTGCAGWWFVSSAGEDSEPMEGWAPSDFLGRLENATHSTVINSAGSSKALTKALIQPLCDESTRPNNAQLSPDDNISSCLR
ncbi:unnamed protein product [Allacma fusca]|uniref:Guanine nucleotide exchange factor DBS n=1 Tax=Allacma fusca TaxID=39272 RepID=A0A8J2L9A1_9HEXA|nr:unnamed protein product [Allacma fusca]